MPNRRSLTTDIALGALAGIAGTFAMDQVTTFLADRQPEEVTKREDEARGGKHVYERAAQKLTRGKASEDQEKRISTGIHWGLGVFFGATYGLMRHRFPRLGLGSGLAYGVLFTLLMDEGASVALGLAPPPTKFPWQTHARGFAGHLVLGGVVEAAFDAADLC
jgi:hypothetical protein